MAVSMVGFRGNEMRAFISSPMIDVLTGRSLQARNCDGMHKRSVSSILILQSESSGENSGIYEG